jgi:hypothetical protein
VSVTATAGTTATQQIAAPGSGATIDLRVPSDLAADEWRDQTELDEQEVVTAVTSYTDGIVLELQEDGDGITIACTPIGLDTAPPTQTTPTPTATPTPTPTTPAPSNSPPTADFTTNRNGNSDNVDLDATPSSDSDGSIVKYEWDVGADGTIEEDGQTVKTKVPRGTKVTLIVTDDDGSTDSITKTVN